MIKITYQDAVFTVDTATEAAELVQLLRREEFNARQRERYARHMAEQYLYEETGVCWHIHKPKEVQR